MQKFEEVAVVRGIKDGKEAGFLLGFLKFAGVSAVEYVYNDLFDGFNKYIEKSKNKFDAVLYINDSGSRYLSRFENLGVANIQLNFSGAWELAEMLKGIFSEVYLVEQAEYEWELRPIQVDVEEKKGEKKKENNMFADALAVFGDWLMCTAKMDWLVRLEIAKDIRRGKSLTAGWRLVRLMRLRKGLRHGSRHCLAWKMLES